MLSQIEEPEIGNRDAGSVAGFSDEYKQIRAVFVIMIIVALGVVLAFGVGRVKDRLRSSRMDKELADTEMKLKDMEFTEMQEGREGLDVFRLGGQVFRTSRRLCFCRSA